jgi:predicted transcriptional regulator
MTVQLTDAQEQRLQQLAATTMQTADELAREGMERFLNYREELHVAVQQGLDDVAAGRLLDHDDVMKMMDEIIENG